VSVKEFWWGFGGGFGFLGSLYLLLVLFTFSISPCIRNVRFFLLLRQTLAQ
jgi:hypothetical protein